MFKPIWDDDLNDYMNLYMIVSGGWKHQPVCCPRRISFDPIPVGGSHFLIQKISESDHITAPYFGWLWRTFYSSTIFTHISRTDPVFDVFSHCDAVFASWGREALACGLATYLISSDQLVALRDELEVSVHGIPGGEWDFLLLSILQHHNSTAMARLDIAWHC